MGLFNKTKKNRKPLFSPLDDNAWEGLNSELGSVVKDISPMMRDIEKHYKLPQSVVRARLLEILKEKRRR